MRLSPLLGMSAQRVCHPPRVQTERSSRAGRLDACLSISQGVNGNHVHVWLHMRGALRAEGCTNMYEHVVYYTDSTAATSQE